MIFMSKKAGFFYQSPTPIFVPVPYPVFVPQLVTKHIDRLCPYEVSKVVEQRIVVPYAQSFGNQQKLLSFYTF